MSKACKQEKTQKNWYDTTYWKAYWRIIVVVGIQVSLDRRAVNGGGGTMKQHLSTMKRKGPMIHHCDNDIDELTVNKTHASKEARLDDIFHSYGGEQAI